MTATRRDLPGRFEERLLDELRHVVSARGPERQPVHNAPRAWIRRHNRLVLVAFAALSGGTALAATTPWNPQVGDDQRGHPTVTQAPAPADQRRVLEVLRRPQEESDRSERVRQALKLLPSAQFAGIELPSVRALQGWPGGAAILVAAQRTGLASPGRGTTRDGLCLIVESQTVNVIENGVRGEKEMPSAGAKCGTVADLKAGVLVLGSELEGRLQLTGLVPDGVTGVEVPLRGAPSLEAPVTNNSFHIDARVPPGAYEDARIKWHGAQTQTSDG